MRLGGGEPFGRPVRPVPCLEYEAIGLQELILGG